MNETLSELFRNEFIACGNDQIAGECEIIEKNGSIDGGRIGVFVDLLPTERKQRLERLHDIGEKHLDGCVLHEKQNRTRTTTSSFTKESWMSGCLAWSNSYRHSICFSFKQQKRNSINSVSTKEGLIA